MIFVALTAPYCENNSNKSCSVVLADMPPTNTLLGTNVPYLGALLPMLLGAGDGEPDTSALLGLDIFTFFAANVVKVG